MYTCRYYSPLVVFLSKDNKLTDVCPDEERYRLSIDSSLTLIFFRLLHIVFLYCAFLLFCLLWNFWSLEDNIIIKWILWNSASVEVFTVAEFQISQLYKAFKLYHRHRRRRHHHYHHHHISHRTSTAELRPPPLTSTLTGWMRPASSDTPRPSKGRLHIS